MTLFVVVIIKVEVAMKIEADKNGVDLRKEHEKSVLCEHVKKRGKIF